MRIAAALVLLSILLAPLHARADIFGYIDEAGHAHFSTEKLDTRYQLFVRGDQAFDSDDLTAPAPSPALLATPLSPYLTKHPNLKKYEPLLNQAASDFNLEPALLKAITAAESGFNPLAVSPKGAVGLMQIMPATAERYGVQTDRKKTIEQKLSEPLINIRLGARYLRDLHRMFPNKPELVIASYNAGEGAVQKYKNQIPPYPETRNYVRLVSQFYQFYKPGASKPAVAATTDKSAPAPRIHMTIPGRSNMPTRSISPIE
ncbi:MAG: lytic transglycosylase domain-containing protein [Herminiimonas sp.]|nr:lytic transglycosylase domain-containing protein [Herminiimonas sp.]